MLEDTERNPNLHQDKDKKNEEYSEEGNDTHDMQMDHPE